MERLAESPCSTVASPAPANETVVSAVDQSRTGWFWRTRKSVANVAAMLFVAGLLIRLTVADRVLVASTIYYATPWSILAALAGIRAIYERSRRNPRASLGWMLAAAACGGTWLGATWHSRGQRVSGETVRIVTWNMAHGGRGLPGIVHALAEEDPDIAILVEADPRRTNVRAIFEKEFPDRHVSLLGGGIVLVSRWPSGESLPYHVGEPEVESRIRQIPVETPWGEWMVFCVDLGSSPFYLREASLRELSRLIERVGDTPVIVAGDFNTPLDSVHYQWFRDLGLTELFEASGSGYLPTWPTPIPVLSLDQIWVSQALKPVLCVREWDRHSDHAGVVGTVVAPAGERLGTR